MDRTPTDDVLAGAHEKGRTTWSGLEVPFQRFEQRVLEVGVSESGLDSWAADFYLASAAADGSPFAINVINVRFVARLANRIRRLGGGHHDTSDILQIVRERLFVGPRARIRAYNAAVPLEQWIKVVGIRTAIDRHRRESRVSRTPEYRLQNQGVQGSRDLVDAIFETEYRTDFETVLRTQLRALSERDRAVLRLHLIENVSIETIAKSRGVHRVTVARWIWNAGELFHEALDTHFKERYGMLPSECESLARLLQSDLSLDLSRLLSPGGSTP